MATETKCESEVIGESIAEIETQIGLLEQERSAADRRATEAARDEERYLAACADSGAAQGKIDALRDRVRRLNVHREAAIEKERAGRIAELQREHQKARFDADAYAIEQQSLKRDAEEKHKREIAKIERRWHELHGLSCKLESELDRLRADEIEVKLRNPNASDRDMLQGELTRCRDGSADRWRRYEHAKSAISVCDKVVNGCAE